MVNLWFGMTAKLFRGSMAMKTLTSLFLLLFGFAATAADRPNIVVIVSDDQGYADVSYNPHSPPEVSTPHIDALAADGVICTNGYASGHVCSPTRAGLMTGRYQQRFGVYTAGEGGSGMPLDEKWIPMFMGEAGYVSGAYGKWHLGLDMSRHPMNRGFNEFYGFMGRGAHPYFDHSDPEHPIYKGLEPVSDEKGYLTTRITEEAVDFIDRRKDEPFFLYVAYNAVHTPAEAPEEDIKPLTDDPLRNTLMAMLMHLDDGVGKIVGKLKEEGLFDNTLLFYLSDNGGASAMNANNAPLRGFKQHDYEGGIRVPFIVSWPKELKGGTTCDVPLWSNDILPTILAATGQELPSEKPVDGVDMMPALKGEVEQLHDELYWSSGGGKGQWAVRSGKWKLVAVKDRVELFDLDADISETTDLKVEHPELVGSLTKKYDTWLDEMAEPLNGAPKHWSGDAGDGKKTRKEEKARKETMRAEKSAASGGSPQPRGGNKSEAKNVLFIVCDDLNTHVSPSGYNHTKTPGLAEFASEAMTFNRAFCQYPVCGPSRASFMNGLYPQSSGVLDNTADIRETRPGTISMPQFFKENGFWTASVGKVFHSPRHEHGEVAWDEFVRFENDELPVVTEAREKFEAEYGPIDNPKNKKLWKPIEKAAKSKLDAQTPPGYGRSGLTEEQHKDGKNARQVAKWLKEEPNGDKPFFIACGIQKPHVPFLAPDKWFDLYPIDQITYRADKPNLWEGVPMSAISKRYEAFGFEFSKENDQLRREYMQAYHACVSFIDAQVKIVLDALKESGHWEDTVVIFTSDHGYHLGDHFVWGKVTLFDIGAKVPFIVHAPGLTTGGTNSDAMVELIDIYPTVAELTGLTPPIHLQGASLVPLLPRPDRPGKKKFAYSVVSRGPNLGYSIRNQRWRYGKWQDGEELYNLTNDPNEKKNLANNPEFEGRLEEFRTALAEMEKEALSKR